MDNKFLELSEVLASLDPEYLEHHGIKGMNWGIRRGPPYPLKSGIRTKIKKVTQAAKNRVEANRNKRTERKEKKEAKRRAKNPTLQDRINAMSDEELRQRTDRLRLENAYKRELPNEKQGESFIRQSAKALNELKAFGDAVSGLVETGKRVSKVLGLDQPNSDDENPNRRPGESLKDYTARMAQLASLKKSRETLGTGSGTSTESSSTSKKDQKKSAESSSESPKPTSTAKTEKATSSRDWRQESNGEKEDSKLSSLREQAKKWNVDIDKPVEKVWDYSSKGAAWFKEASSPEKSFFSDWTREEDDEKKKKGG